VTRKTKEGRDPDEPFRRVVLVPFDSVTVVHRELVVEIVIAFTDGDECGDHMVSRGVFVVERGFTKPVG